VITAWLGFLMAGAISGLLAGLFGVGGGLIIVPILLWVFAWQGMEGAFVIHVAIATSLAAISITSLSSVWAHHKLANTQWHLVKQLAPTLVIGSAIGAYITSLLSKESLQFWFGLFAIFAAVKLWLPAPKEVSVRLLLKPVILLYGAITGVISAMVGIGGGTFIVPYLVMSGLSIQKAVGTAAACGFPIAVSGIITYMIIGQAHQPVTTSWQTGFVNWQAFVGIVSTSIWMAPVGAKIATKLSATLLSRLFSVLLLFIGVMFIMR